LEVRAWTCVRRCACHGDGTEGIGSAFHVGDGVFVTARHVVDNTELVEVEPTTPTIQPITQALPFTEPAKATYLEVLGQEPCWPVYGSSLRVLEGPSFHRNPKVDIAVFRAAPIGYALPHLPLTVAESPRNAPVRAADATTPGS
jgi:hypothetical protein